MEIAVLEGRAIGGSCVYVKGLERLRTAMEVCSILKDRRDETGREERKGIQQNCQDYAQINKQQKGPVDIEESKDAKQRQLN